MAHSQLRRRPDPRQARRVSRGALGPNRVSSFLNLRVADIQACYRDWEAKGAHFLTELLVGQYTQRGIEAFANLSG
jgi:hypothetical protein